MGSPPDRSAILRRSSPSATSDPGRSTDLPTLPLELKVTGVPRNPPPATAACPIRRLILSSGVRRIRSSIRELIRVHEVAHTDGLSFEGPVTALSPSL